MQYKYSEYNEQEHDLFKALSVNEPHVTNIENGSKTIELRTRNTPYRGPLMICSTVNHKTKELGKSRVLVNLYDVKKASELTPEEIEKCCVKNFTPYQNGFAWFLKDAQKVINYPVKGQLGIFNLIYTKDTIMPFPTRINFEDVKKEMRNNIHRAKMREVAPQRRRFKKQLLIVAMSLFVLMMWAVLHWVNSRFWHLF